METPRFILLSKALLKVLSRDISSLTHERLADQFKYILKYKKIDDAQIANAMNAYKAVIGNRGQGVRIFAHIDEKKIVLFNAHLLTRT